MTTQTTQTPLSEIWKALLNGSLSPDAARRLLADVKDAFGTNLKPEGIESILQSAAEQRQQGVASGAAWAQTPLDNTPGAVEARTDPLTAYLSRLGIGSKQNYNPAEAYQAGLFDPYKSQYDIQQRLSRPGASYQNPANQSATFSDFLGKVGGGIGGLEQGARNQLQSIFGGTAAQKSGVFDPLFPSDTGALNYEPSQYTAGSQGEAAGQGPNQGNLSELADLFRYGLRNKAGIQGARYAAGALPKAQQAYYGQKTAGQLGTGSTNFLDWLKQNWGLQF